MIFIIYYQTAAHNATASVSTTPSRTASMSTTQSTTGSTSTVQSSTVCMFKGNTINGNLTSQVTDAYIDQIL